MKSYRFTLEDEMLYEALYETTTIMDLSKKKNLLKNLKMIEKPLERRRHKSKRYWWLNRIHKSIWRKNQKLHRRRICRIKKTYNRTRKSLYRNKGRRYDRWL